MVDKAFIQSLVDDADLVGIIGKYVPLKKAGKDFIGLCPFHSENSPSFSVSARKKFYYCFGCGATGDAISFLQNYEGLSFRESLETLANQLGRSIPVSNPENFAKAEQKRQEQRTLSQTNEQAADFYRARLLSEHIGRDYLFKRGISEQTSEAFYLGYAPEGWNALSQAFSPYPDKNLLAVGLIKSNPEKAAVYDMFRNRLMFPIRNSVGSVVGFGGRTFGDDKPKYLNTGETELFKKSRELYGYFENKQRIRQQDVCYVAEGYMDVLAMYQNGLPAVAVMGTAFQEGHYKTLIAQTKNIVFIFDGDDAGQRAAFSAMKLCFGQMRVSENLAFCILPDNQDAADLLGRFDTTEFKQYISQHTISLVDFFINYLGQKHKTDHLEGKSKLLYEAKELLEYTKDVVLLELLIGKLATMASVSPDFAKGIITGKRRRGFYKNWRSDLPEQAFTVKKNLHRAHKMVAYVLASPQAAQDAKINNTALEIIQTDTDVALLEEVLEALLKCPVQPLSEQKFRTYLEQSFPALFSRTVFLQEEIQEAIYQVTTEQMKSLFDNFVSHCLAEHKKLTINRLREKMKTKPLSPEEQALLIQYLS